MCVHICALNTHEHIRTYTYKERWQLLAQTPTEMNPEWFWIDFTEEHMETSLKLSYMGKDKSQAANFNANLDAVEE